MCYPLIRKLLFLLPPETAHTLALRTLNMYGRIKGQTQPTAALTSPIQIMGLNFPNAVGAAAGLDRNGDYLPGLSAMGFGFIEVGGVTPKPQPGNPKPRLFRLTEQNALINRFGFSGKGLTYLVSQLKQRTYAGVLGINIAKNLTTPLTDALSDYQHCFEKLYPYADFVTVNISSPNTPGLRELQFESHLEGMLTALKAQQKQLHAEQGRYVPLVLKIAPDLTDSEIEKIATLLLKSRFDGVIATNTTIERPGLSDVQKASEAGGLSGAPLLSKSTHVVEVLHRHLKGEIPIIACGGILSAQDAQAKIDAGASLVQIFTGFIYRGPRLVKEIVEKIS